MDNSTALPLEGDELLYDQLALISPTTVAGAFFGVAFSLFCLYVHALAPQLRDGDKKRQARFMLGYSTIVMFCGLYNLAANAWVIQNAYTEHADYPGGPQSYIDESMLTTDRLVAARVVAISFACELIIDIFTMAIQIWRVWVVWGTTGHARFVVVLPLVLCFLTLATLETRSIILNFTLPSTEILQVDGKTQIAELAIQGVITILCTILISLYLVFHQWQQRKLIGRTEGSTGYMYIVAMLVESYALESLWLIVTAAIWGLSTSAFFAETISYIEIIAYLLVQYRVAWGKSYESQRGPTAISSLRWNNVTNHATTQLTEHDAVNAEHPSHATAIPRASRSSSVSNMA